MDIYVTVAIIRIPNSLLLNKCTVLQFPETMMLSANDYMLHKNFEALQQPNKYIVYLSSERACSQRDFLKLVGQSMCSNGIHTDHTIHQDAS